MTHDYKRNGTTTLFAALNVLDGKVISQCQQRHRHIEWLPGNPASACISPQPAHHGPTWWSGSFGMSARVGYAVVCSHVQKLTSAINDYVVHYITNPKPLVWTKSAREILQKVIRVNDNLSSIKNATLHQISTQFLSMYSRLLPGRLFRLAVVGCRV